MYKIWIFNLKLNSSLKMTKTLLPLWSTRSIFYKKRSKNVASLNFAFLPSRFLFFRRYLG